VGVNLTVAFVCSALKNLKKLNLNSTRLSALTFEGLKVRNGRDVYWMTQKTGLLRLPLRTSLKRLNQ